VRYSVVRSLTIVEVKWLRWLAGWHRNWLL
jgi:hypothetical protein